MRLLAGRFRRGVLLLHGCGGSGRFASPLQAAEGLDPEGDFAYDQITVRDGKGAKDRVTMLPASLKVDLLEHLKRVKHLHNEDL